MNQDKSELQVRSQSRILTFDIFILLTGCAADLRRNDDCASYVIFQPCRERPLPVIELSDLAICLRLEYPRLRGLRKGLQIQSAHYPENHGQNQ